MSPRENVYYPPPLPRGPGAFAGAFMRGASLPIRGVSFIITHPGLWPLVIIPLVLNLVVFVGVLTWGFSTFAGGLDAWMQGLEGWYVAPVKITLQVLFWLVVLVVVYFVFTPVALLIAAPFNDRIAEHTERAYGFTMPEDNRPMPIVVAREVLFAILSEAKRLVFTLSVFAALLLLNLLPVIGSAMYLAASLTWGAWSVAFEFSSYAGDRRHLGLRAKMRLLQRFPGASFGFGAVALLMLMVPFLNALMVPMLAVSGTMLFCMLAASDGDRSR